MHTLSLFGVASLLAGCALATPTTSSSPTKLVRRHEQPAFTNIHIMRAALDYSHGPLQIHNPEGSVAFLFDKVMRDPIRGVSSTVVMDPSSRILLSLDSYDDICRHRTHYTEPDVIGANHRKFEINPRGAKADRWKFSFVAPSGEEFSYEFHRHYLNKDEQIRWEPWLTPGTAGTSTLTLSSTADAPLVELVALMGLVLTRVYQCGL
ncbi:hypothetical protein VP01_115g7 [Puccinia sorghi]|uniref:Glycoside hydrolase 131 catalytic N-terminal domain-containing protein n=1 Tax=Puccinia sorghi TaxID=27349 RepID=A0A0L6VSZ6_9BASI|nr:hypothetical protein VP01_115g7 [Puccinia sorghi]